MRRLLITVMTIGCMLQQQLATAQSAEAQQLLLNVEKLAQLKQILTDMKKGYEIVSKGYGTVKSISEGDFSLHDAFLNGLLTVNPELKKYRRVADIIQYQVRILSEYKTAYNRFRDSGRFTTDELLYMGKVYGSLFDQSLQNLDEMTMILTSGQLRMSDDDRIKAIDRLYADMQEKLGFLRSFNKKTMAVHDQRTQLQKEADQLRKLYGTR